ncbi:hypothetical protein AMAG_10051 [Allomyces macrogynus ATCC 38327]|uniref:GATA-type domain-containing protein n=1 Tax=Allomyces macrogynus (strain ATCC 38327) TaxID=578462 RepID=A0A0L0SQP8_ALLM3|nr:hypothetical protein AMAG_10051 [Allomyces macrogynus ATCC 38327]|eukprot:KNE64699.1 hypothetical protein AMAG_10051 [Allomyces macrogynus ATCC 38327]
MNSSPRTALAAVREGHGANDHGEQGDGVVAHVRPDHDDDGPAGGLPSTTQHPLPPQSMVSITEEMVSRAAGTQYSAGVHETAPQAQRWAATRSHNTAEVAATTTTSAPHGQGNYNIGSDGAPIRSPLDVATWRKDAGTIARTEASESGRPKLAEDSVPVPTSLTHAPGVERFLPALGPDARTSLSDLTQTDGNLCIALFVASYLHHSRHPDRPIYQESYPLPLPEPIVSDLVAALVEMLSVKHSHPDCVLRVLEAVPRAFNGTIRSFKTMRNIVLDVAIPPTTNNWARNRRALQNPERSIAVVNAIRRYLTEWLPTLVAAGGIACRVAGSAANGLLIDAIPCIFGALEVRAHGPRRVQWTLARPEASVAARYLCPSLNGENVPAMSAEMDAFLNGSNGDDDDAGLDAAPQPSHFHPPTANILVPQPLPQAAVATATLAAQAPRPPPATSGRDPLANLTPADGNLCVALFVAVHADRQRNPARPIYQRSFALPIPANDVSELAEVLCDILNAGTGLDRRLRSFPVSDTAPRQGTRAIHAQLRVRKTVRIALIEHVPDSSTLNISARRKLADRDPHRTPIVVAKIREYVTTWAPAMLAAPAQGLPFLISDTVGVIKYPITAIPCVFALGEVDGEGQRTVRWNQEGADAALFLYPGLADELGSATGSGENGSEPDEGIGHQQAMDVDRHQTPAALHQYPPTPMRTLSRHDVLMSMVPADGNLCIMLYIAAYLDRLAGADRPFHDKLFPLPLSDADVSVLTMALTRALTSGVGLDREVRAFSDGTTATLSIQAPSARKLVRTLLAGATAPTEAALQAVDVHRSVKLAARIRRYLTEWLPVLIDLGGVPFTGSDSTASVANVPLAFDLVVDANGRRRAIRWVAATPETAQAAQVFYMGMRDEVAAMRRADVPVSSTSDAPRVLGPIDTAQPVQRAALVPVASDVPDSDTRDWSVSDDTSCGAANGSADATAAPPTAWSARDSNLCIALFAAAYDDQLMYPTRAIYQSEYSLPLTAPETRVLIDHFVALLGDRLNLQLAFFNPPKPNAPDDGTVNKRRTIRTVLTELHADANVIGRAAFKAIGRNAHMHPAVRLAIARYLTSWIPAADAGFPIAAKGVVAVDAVPAVLERHVRDDGEHVLRWAKLPENAEDAANALFSEMVKRSRFSAGQAVGWEPAATHSHDHAAAAGDHDGAAPYQDDAVLGHSNAARDVAVSALAETPGDHAVVHGQVAEDRMDLAYAQREHGGDHDITTYDQNDAVRDHPMRDHDVPMREVDVAEHNAPRVLADAAHAHVGATAAAGGATTNPVDPVTEYLAIRNCNACIAIFAAVYDDQRTNPTRAIYQDEYPLPLTDQHRTQLVDHLVSILGERLNHQLAFFVESRTTITIDRRRTIRLILSEVVLGTRVTPSARQSLSRTPHSHPAVRQWIERYLTEWIPAMARTPGFAVPSDILPVNAIPGVFKLHDREDGQHVLRWPNLPARDPAAADAFFSTTVKKYRDSSRMSQQAIVAPSTPHVPEPVTFLYRLQPAGPSSTGTELDLSAAREIPVIEASRVVARSVVDRIELGGATREQFDPAHDPTVTIVRIHDEAEHDQSVIVPHLADDASRVQDEAMRDQPDEAVYDHPDVPISQVGAIASQANVTVGQEVQEGPGTEFTSISNCNLCTALFAAAYDDQCHNPTRAIYQDEYTLPLTDAATTVLVDHFVALLGDRLNQRLSAFTSPSHINWRRTIRVVLIDLIAGRADTARAVHLFGKTPHLHPAVRQAITQYVTSWIPAIAGKAGFPIQPGAAAVNDIPGVLEQVDRDDGLHDLRWKNLPERCGLAATALFAGTVKRSKDSSRAPRRAAMQQPSTPSQLEDAGAACASPVVEFHVDIPCEQVDATHDRGDANIDQDMADRDEPRAATLDHIDPARDQQAASVAHEHVDDGNPEPDTVAGDEVAAAQDLANAIHDHDDAARAGVDAVHDDGRPAGALQTGIDGDAVPTCPAAGEALTIGNYNLCIALFAAAYEDQCTNSTHAIYDTEFPLPLTDEHRALILRHLTSILGDRLSLRMTAFASTGAICKKRTIRAVLTELYADANLGRGALQALGKAAHLHPVVQEQLKQYLTAWIPAVSGSPGFMIRTSEIAVRAVPGVLEQIDCENGQHVLRWLNLPERCGPAANAFFAGTVKRSRDSTHTPQWPASQPSTPEQSAGSPHQASTSALRADVNSPGNPVITVRDQDEDMVDQERDAPGDHVDVVGDMNVGAAADFTTTSNINVCIALFGAAYDDQRNNSTRAIYQSEFSVPLTDADTAHLADHFVSILGEKADLRLAAFTSEGTINRRRTIRVVLAELITGGKELTRGAFQYLSKTAHLHRIVRQAIERYLTDWVPAAAGSLGFPIQTGVPPINFIPCVLEQGVRYDGQQVLRWVNLLDRCGATANAVIFELAKQTLTQPNMALRAQHSPSSCSRLGSSRPLTASSSNSSRSDQLVAAGLADVYGDAAAEPGQMQLNWNPAPEPMAASNGIAMDARPVPDSQLDSDLSSLDEAGDRSLFDEDDEIEGAMDEQPEPDLAAVDKNNVCIALFAAVHDDQRTNPTRSIYQDEYPLPLSNEHRILLIDHLASVLGERLNVRLALFIKTKTDGSIDRRHTIRMFLMELFAGPRARVVRQSPLGIAPHLNPIVRHHLEQYLTTWIPALVAGSPGFPIHSSALAADFIPCALEQYDRDDGQRVLRWVKLPDQYSATAQTFSSDPVARSRDSRSRDTDPSAEYPVEEGAATRADDETADGLTPTGDRSLASQWALANFGMIVWSSVVDNQRRDSTNPIYGKSFNLLANKELDRPQRNELIAHLVQCCTAANSKAVWQVPPHGSDRQQQEELVPMTVSHAMRLIVNPVRKRGPPRSARLTTFVTEYLDALCSQSDSASTWTTPTGQTIPRVLDRGTIAPDGTGTLAWSAELASSTVLFWAPDGTTLVNYKDVRLRQLKSASSKTPSRPTIVTPVPSSASIPRPISTSRPVGHERTAAELAALTNRSQVRLCRLVGRLEQHMLATLHLPANRGNMNEVLATWSSHVKNTAYMQGPATAAGSTLSLVPTTDEDDLAPYLASYLASQLAVEFSARVGSLTDADAEAMCRAVRDVIERIHELADDPPAQAGYFSDLYDNTAAWVQAMRAALDSTWDLFGSLNVHCVPALAINVVRDAILEMVTVLATLARAGVRAEFPALGCGYDAPRMVAMGPPVVTPAAHQERFPDPATPQLQSPPDAWSPLLLTSHSAMPPPVTPSPRPPPPAFGSSDTNHAQARKRPRPVESERVAVEPRSCVDCGDKEAFEWCQDPMSGHWMCNTCRRRRQFSTNTTAPPMVPALTPGSHSNQSHAPSAADSGSESVALGSGWAEPAQGAGHAAVDESPAPSKRPRMEPPAPLPSPGQSGRLPRPSPTGLPCTGCQATTSKLWHEAGRYCASCGLKRIHAARRQATVDSSLSPSLPPRPDLPRETAGPGSSDCVGAGYGPSRAIGDEPTDARSLKRRRDRDLPEVPQALGQSSRMPRPSPTGMPCADCQATTSLIWHEAGRYCGSCGHRRIRAATAASRQLTTPLSGPSTSDRPDPARDSAHLAVSDTIGAVHNRRRASEQEPTDAPSPKRRHVETLHCACGVTGPADATWSHDMHRNAVCAACQERTRTYAVPITAVPMPPQPQPSMLTAGASNSLTGTLQQGQQAQ